MLKLNNIKSTVGTTRNRKRIGRGYGSGWGKTAGRGGKGQTARSGYSAKAGFEGGQTPLFRRIPKRGFKNFMREEFAVVNLTQLDILNPADFPEVSLDSLQKARVIGSRRFKRLAVLGVGELKAPLKIRAHRVSASAQEKIKKAGGSVEILVS